jgi:hypothetical protein
VFCFLLDIRNSCSEVVAMLLAFRFQGFHLCTEFCMFVVEPIRDLPSAEGKLTRAVSYVENGQWMVRWHFPRHSKSSASWCRN